MHSIEYGKPLPFTFTSFFAHLTGKPRLSLVMSAWLSIVDRCRCPRNVNKFRCVTLTRCWMTAESLSLQFTLLVLQCIFQSHIFHPCSFGPAFSSPAFFTPVVTRKCIFNPCICHTWSCNFLSYILHSRIFSIPVLYISNWKGYTIFVLLLISTNLIVIHGNTVDWIVFNSRVLFWDNLTEQCAKVCITVCWCNANCTAVIR